MKRPKRNEVARRSKKEDNSTVKRCILASTYPATGNSRSLSEKKERYLIQQSKATLN